MPFQPQDYKLKVVIGIPFSGRYVAPEWALGLVSLQWPMNIRYAYAPVNCSRQEPKMSREQAREYIVQVALDSQAQYVLMLDDDVHPPPDVVTCLIRELDSRGDEWAAIGAIYASRADNPEPVVFQQQAGGAHWRWKVGDIFECAEIGTGCLLIRTDVFTKIPKPWFRDLSTRDEAIAAGLPEYREFDRGAMTDDIFFCRRLAQYKYRLLAHGGALCKHWGRKGEYYELSKDAYPFRPQEIIDPRVHAAMCINGWMSHDELCWLADQAATHSEILEVGSFQGRSTRALAENTSGRVTAVDVWQPTPDTIKELDGKPPEWLWDEFRFNMLGLTNVHALRMPSLEAAATVPDSVKFDMIFIDADHSYEACKADIEAWRAKLAPGGLLCGHDWTWPGVQQAITELLPTRVKLKDQEIWYVPTELNE